MYRPKTGEIVSWYWQGSRPGDAPAIQTAFTDIGDLQQWTPVAVLARYGDPRPALRQRAADVAPLGNIEELVASPTSYTYFRFFMDPEKGELPGLIRVAAQDRFNLWGLEELPSLPAYQQASDFAACGPIAELRRLYGHLLGQVGMPPPGSQPQPDPSAELRRQLAAARADLETARFDHGRALETLERIQARASGVLANLPKSGGGRPAQIGREFAAWVLEQ